MPWLWAPEPQERLPLLGVCLPREPGGENRAGNQIENPDVGGGGKAGEWSEGSLENRGVFCSLRGERGVTRSGTVPENRRRQRPWKAAGKKPSLREEMLLLVLSFLDKRFLSI